MVALNEKFSHSGVPASEGRVSPDVIDAFDFTKRSGEVRGGSVVNFGGAGSRGLSDAPPLRRRSAAPVNRNDPETRLYYVRNRMFLTDAGGISVGRWIQRDPIGYQGGINLYEYVGGRAVVGLDPMGEFIVPGIPGPALFWFFCKGKCDEGGDTWGFVDCIWCPGTIDIEADWCDKDCCLEYNSGTVVSYLDCVVECFEELECYGCSTP